MHSGKWTSEIDQITHDFRQSFGSLTIERLNWKPDAQTWSIAQILDHLIVINRSYFPVIQAIRNGTYKLPLIGKLGFMVSSMGKMVLKAVQPDRKNKMKTFPLWEPAMNEIQRDMLDRFARHQDELKELIKSSADLLEKGVLISSPANRNIVYKLETAFDIIVAHERRHFQQAKETEKTMGVLHHDGGYPGR